VLLHFLSFGPLQHPFLGYARLLNHFDSKKKQSASSNSPTAGINPFHADQPSTDNNRFRGKRKWGFGLHSNHQFIKHAKTDIPSSQLPGNKASYS